MRMFRATLEQDLRTHYFERRFVRKRHQEWDVCKEGFDVKNDSILGERCNQIFKGRKYFKGRSWQE